MYIVVTMDSDNSTTSSVHTSRVDAFKKYEELKANTFEFGTEMFEVTEKLFDGNTHPCLTSISIKIDNYSYNIGVFAV